MPTAMDVANYFLATLGSQPENDLTNMKVQKLCAYSQGLCLGILDRQLFDEEIEAWQFGPVIPIVYQTFGNNAEKPIPRQGLSEKYARELFGDEEKFILELVKNYYGIFTAGELSRRSHRDFPGQFGSKRIIAKEDIKKAFSADPLVLKIKTEVKPCPYSPQTDKLVPQNEIWNALEV